MFGSIFQWILKLFSQKNGYDGLDSPSQPSPSLPSSSTNENLSPEEKETNPKKEVDVLLPLSLKQRIDKDTFLSAMGGNRGVVGAYYLSILDSMDKYNINTYQRVVLFLATIGHESFSMHYTAELWGPTPAQSRYSNRVDLGNTHPEAIKAAVGAGRSVGFHYRGHGLIQVTGYYNHLKCGEALGLDLVNNPDLLTTPKWAAESACWWWANNGCNELADSGDIRVVTRRVNGGYNGIKDREARVSVARAIITPW